MSSLLFPLQFISVVRKLERREKFSTKSSLPEERYNARKEHCRACSRTDGRKIDELYHAAAKLEPSQRRSSLRAHSVRSIKKRVGQTFDGSNQRIASGVPATFNSCFNQRASTKSPTSLSEHFFNSSIRSRYREP